MTGDVFYFSRFPVLGMSEQFSRHTISPLTMRLGRFPRFLAICRRTSYPQENQRRHLLLFARAVTLNLPP